MKRRLFLSFLVLSPIIILLHAQATDSTSEKIVRAFLNREGIKNKKAIYCGEMLQRYLKTPTLGQSLPPTVEKSCRLLSIRDTRAIYAVVIKNDTLISDWYFYLNKAKTTWKLEAVRSLALPGFFFDILHDLKNKPFRTDNEEVTYENMDLIVSCDSVVKTYLVQNFNDFQKLERSFTAGEKNTTAHLIKKLHLTSVQPFQSNGRIIEFLIGGILDNSVGFFYIPDGCIPPEMNADSYIYIERIIDNWYIFKTT
jgi:hypothetical protein